eukprot:1179639-Prorocentrum_minimum.AAC.4
MGATPGEVTSIREVHAIHRRTAQRHLARRHQSERSIPCIVAQHYRGGDHRDIPAWELQGDSLHRPDMCRCPRGADENGGSSGTLFTLSQSCPSQKMDLTPFDLIVTDKFLSSKGV